MKAIVFVDGGYLRALTRRAGYRYDPNYIEAVAPERVPNDETLLRILRYDCAPFSGDPPLRGRGVTSFARMQIVSSGTSGSGVAAR